MKFEVAYRDAEGKMAETTVEVSDRNAVYSELRRQGITPLSLREAGTKKHVVAASSALYKIAKLVILLAILGVAAASAWYFLLADEGTKRHLRNIATPSTKVDMHNSGQDAPRKGTGAVSVKMSK